MNKDWMLTEESFTSLLDWLGKDRTQAGHKYEQIRVRLIKIFTCRGCNEAEDLADETINRVTAKVNQIRNSYEGDPALYFYGVAHKLFLEYLRRPRLASADSIPVKSGATESHEDEYEYACLDQCVQTLSSENRRLVLGYYEQQKRAKIDHRKELADELGITINSLRIRAHRIRQALQECVRKCLEQQPAH